MTETNEEAVAAEVTPATATQTAAVVAAQLSLVASMLNEIRLVLDKLSTERGVPIKNTSARLTKAREYVEGARQYWDYDVVQGHAKLTKSERQRAEGFELS